MLDQGEPRPPRAGPLGPARAQMRYLLKGSAPALERPDRPRLGGVCGSHGGRAVPAVFSMYSFQALNSLGSSGEPQVSTSVVKERNLKVGEGRVGC